VGAARPELARLLPELDPERTPDRLRSAAAEPTG
jgi:hypothetical protein